MARATAVMVTVTAAAGRRAGRGDGGAGGARPRLHPGFARGGHRGSRAGCGARAARARSRPRSGRIDLGGGWGRGAARGRRGREQAGLGSAARRRRGAAPRARRSTAGASDRPRAEQGAQLGARRRHDRRLVGPLVEHRGVDAVGEARRLRLRVGSGSGGWWRLEPGHRRLGRAGVLDPRAVGRLDAALQLAAGASSRRGGRWPARVVGVVEGGASARTSSPSSAGITGVSGSTGLEGALVTTAEASSNSASISA